MSLVLLAVIGVLLTIWPSPATPAALSCSALPPGSVAQLECEYLQAKLQAQRVPGPGPWDLPAGATEAVTHFACSDEKAVEIGRLEGTLGAELRGTYRNLGPAAVSEVIVGFALFDARNQVVKTIEAAVLPRTIPPSGTGAFTAVVPAPAALGWTCFRYEITGVPD